MADEDEARLLEWQDLLDETNYYELLGVLEIADELAIRQAFHEFALAFHPDGHLDRGPEILATARRVFQRGVEAYRVLANPELRARYDLELAKGRLRLASEAGLPPEPGRASKAGQGTQTVGLAAAGGESATGHSPGRAPGGSPVQSLDELCRSAAARLAARHADELISQGDLRGAKRELQMALYHDGGDNPALADRLDALEVALFAMGE
jgi:curved DNA-binding protein CbpA